MTTTKNNDLIGNDPLAWMEEEVHGVAQERVDKDTDAGPDQDVAGQEPSASPDDADVPVVLPAILNIQGAARLHEQLLAVLQGRKQVIIDARNVNSIDTAALQLLVIFRQETLKSSLDMRIDAPSSQLIAAARLLDVADLLEVA